jgi:enoyl-CoA hydratase
MRYMLTGEHWGAQQAYRMGLIQEIAPQPSQGAGIGDRAGPEDRRVRAARHQDHAGVRSLSIDESEAAAFSKLNEQFGELFHTEDFTEDRKAEAEGHPPVYQGK